MSDFDVGLVILGVIAVCAFTAGVITAVEMRVAAREDRAMERALRQIERWHRERAPEERR